MYVFVACLHMHDLCHVYVSVIRDLTSLCDTAACLDVKVMVMLWKTVSR